MSKTYKGYELIKEIAEGNIKDGTRFKDSSGNIYIKINDTGYLEDESGNTILDCFYSLDELALTLFEQIEDKEDEIDIQDIEEFSSLCAMSGVEFEIQDKLNEIIRAIKQLDNKINK